MKFIYLSLAIYDFTESLDDVVEKKLSLVFNSNGVYNS